MQAEYAKVTRPNKWAIPWLEDDPGSNLVQLFVNRTLEYSRSAIAMNCSGLLGIHWRTASIFMNVKALADAPWKDKLTSLELYEEIVRAEFGLSGEGEGDVDVREELAQLLDGIDSYRDDIQVPKPGEDVVKQFERSYVAIPRPASWGPGLVDIAYVYEEDSFSFVNLFDSFRDHLVKRNKVSERSGVERSGAEWSGVEWSGAERCKNENSRKNSKKGRSLKTP